MKFLGSFLLLFSIGLGTACHGPVSSGNQAIPLKLMSYNIRIGKGGGEWNYDPRKVDLSPVISIIEKEKVDLAGLQEVDRFRERTSLMNQPADLGRALSLNVAFEPAYVIQKSTGTNEEYGNVLLSRHTILSTERIALFKPDYSKSNPSYPDYYSEQRGLLHAEVMIRKQKVHVWVTHLGLTADQRAKQVEQIIDEASRVAAPTVIMGDFNALPSEPAMTKLAEHFTDVLSAVNTKVENRRSYPAGQSPKEAIDYIFVSKHFRVKQAHVLRDSSLASDHNPVVAEVVLNN